MRPQPEDIEPMVQEGVKQAIELAKDNGITLDYSDDSIKEVEKMLGELHDDYKKNGEQEGFSGLMLMLAFYIGEVIRQKGLGGKWERNHPQFGEDSFPFYWRGKTLFIFGWCQKRVFDGDGDDVWFKYQVSVIQFLQ